MPDSIIKNGTRFAAKCTGGYEIRRASENGARSYCLPSDQPINSAGEETVFGTRLAAERAIARAVAAEAKVVEVEIDLDAVAPQASLTPAQEDELMRRSASPHMFLRLQAE
jgi:hypothetical protein